MTVTAIRTAEQYRTQPDGSTSRTRTIVRLTTGPERWAVVTSAATNATLHRTGCRHLGSAKPANTDTDPFDGPRSAAWVWGNRGGYRHACRTCCPDLHP